MTRYISSFILLLLTIILLPGCQRDDICPETTDTTPLLIIRFYEDEAPFDPQAPQNLRVRSLANDSTFIYDRFSRDSIAIPLRTDNDVSEFVFTLNAPASENAEDQGNSDILTFSYGREEEYISRACAFRISYVALKVDVSEPGNGENWIEDIRIEQPNVENENQAHVSIFF